MGNLTYKKAGVDTKEGERAVNLMKEHVKKTMTPNVLTGLGSFGGLFKLPLDGMKEPVLVSGTDGVGTKLKIGFLTDRHNTVGIDCVAMCVNDVLCQGAIPLFFLDYIATGKVTAEKIAHIVEGIAEGCRLGESALIGGETAEMPGFYKDGEYDIAGFSVGLADREKIITGEDIVPGDSIIGLPSSGIHSNGYSLVRKIFFEKAGLNVNSRIPGLSGTLGDALLEPTRIYTKPCKALFEKHHIKGIVHITGGGFFENIPRVLPEGTAALIEQGSWEILPIFEIIAKLGNVDIMEMFSTFNMGIGMMFFVKKEDEKEVVRTLEQIGEKPRKIGSVIKKEKEEVVFYGKEDS